MKFVLFKVSLDLFNAALEVTEMELDNFNNTLDILVHEEKGEQKPYRAPAMAVVGTVAELTGGPVTFTAETNGFHN